MPPFVGLLHRLRRFTVADPRRSGACGVAAAATTGLVLGGPVAAVVLAAYSALAARALVRRARVRHRAEVRTRSVDDLCALAADLRAGLPPAAASGGLARRPSEAGEVDARVAELTAAVWRLAERTGAPAADLVERIEADARAADRAQASAAAQAAGAQATAMLLAALPLGGIALGHSIGVDATGVLLHTTLGGACALGAVVLQTAGLVWSERLVRGSGR
jgi:tight adherence protein B